MNEKQSVLYSANKMCEEGITAGIGRNSDRINGNPRTVRTHHKDRHKKKGTLRVLLKRLWRDYGTYI